MKKQALKFIKKHSLSKNNLTSGILRDIFTRYGYRIVFFNDMYNSQPIQRLINAYGIDELAKYRRVFIFNDDSAKLLFIHEYVGEDELIHYLLHELGHIWLQHTNILNNEDRQEREADEFAAQVKLCLEQQYYLKRIIPIGIIIAIIVIWSIGRSYPTAEPNTYTPVPTMLPTTTSSPTQNTSDIVVVTKSGEKYHLPDCRHVEGRNVSELTVSEAIKQGYEPCKDCNP